MPNKTLRICITTKDIVIIEECSQRTASQKMSDMRIYFNKNNKHNKITFNDYAIYSGIPLNELEPFRQHHLFPLKSVI